jgi:integrase/recombinase XerD
VLSITEVEAIMAGPEVSQTMGNRDRAILETLYSTGIRRMEVVNLKVFDLDAERGTVMVRQGKGKKDRMVPIGERALTWIQKYLDEVRAGLAVNPDDGVLFLTAEGEAFTPNRLTQLVREYVDKAKLKKRGSCHLFRHTMATLMLEGGADIRFNQAMLGHAELSTTQIYTQVSIRKLKEIHDATHPGARPQTRRTTEDPEAGARADLLDALAAEAHDEGADPDPS